MRGLHRSPGTAGREIREIEAEAEKHDAWAKTCKISVHGAKTMLETMPDASQLFLAEDEQARAEWPQAEQQAAGVAAALAVLGKRFAVEHDGVRRKRVFGCAAGRRRYRGEALRPVTVVVDARGVRAMDRRVRRMGGREDFGSLP